MFRYDWRQGLLCAVFWLVPCPLLGVAAAVVCGEFGSIVFVWIGTIVGMSGAISNAALIAFARFMAADRLAQWTCLALGATLLPLLWGMATLRDGPSIAILVEIFLSALGCAALSAGLATQVVRPRAPRWR